MTKIKVNKALHASLSALLVLVLLVTSLPLTSMNTSAETVSQTKYENITDFQNARWSEIQSKVFGKDFGGEVQPIETIKDLTVQNSQDNTYFHWTDTSKMQGYNNDGTEREGGLKKYDGTDTVTSMGYVDINEGYLQKFTKYDSINVPIPISVRKGYRCYNVYTADQFVYLANYAANNGKSIKMVLQADIDMGGAEGKEFTTGKQLLSNLCIEGNGHTIYNWKMSGSSDYFGLFCSSSNNIPSVSFATAALIVKNLGVQSAMLLHHTGAKESGAGLFLGGGWNNGGVLFDNVHMNGMFFQQDATGTGSGIGFMGGRGSYKNNLLVNNCSTSNGYMYGKGHLGGMFSYTQSRRKTLAKYDVKFPESPEAIVYMSPWTFNETGTDEKGNPKTISWDPYPVFFNNCSSVDCELFSTGDDSGAFVSCGSGILAVNCYTNNTMYSNGNTGGFIGRVGHNLSSRLKTSTVGDIEATDACMYDDNGKPTIGCCFRNCYTAGVVEGQRAMGGFTGLDCGYRVSDHSDTQENASLQHPNTTVYSNCYSTTMVGMDYAGKFCGGFTGLEDNYSRHVNWNNKEEDLTVKIDDFYGASVTASDGTKIENIYGSVYMNCYAAGEVGNILTASDTEKAVEYEKTFYSDGYYKSEENMENPQYYPSGGFIGSINPDIYFLKTGDSVRRISLTHIYGDHWRAMPGTENYTYGYFYNCYYDMQTSGMREMAIGLAYAETCRDDPTGNNKRQGFSDDTKVVHKDAEGNEIPFSVIGITGVYTEKSDVKNVAGLTGSPVEYKDGSGNVLSRMSMSGEGSVKEDDSNWQYNDGYYPQLKAFMSSDTTVGNINDTQASDITNDVRSSALYVGEAEAVTETKEDGKVYITKPATHPVMSLVNSKEKIYENYQPNTNVYAAELASVLIPYRYSQASTATVKLSHWDYKMNTTDGSLSTDNDWACGVASNQLKLNSDTGYFENTYTGLSSGKYSFKVQANSSMTYNYGSNRFDGQNCELNIPVENCSARIMFKYNGLRSQDYQIYAVLANSNGEPIDENGAKTVDQNGNPVEKKILLGGTATDVNPDVWTLVGTLPNSTWNVTDAKYDLKISPTNSSIYTYTCDFTPNKDESGNYVETECQFKIAKDHAWTESYGIAGKSDNMSFKYNQPCTVYFEFNTKTHITTVKATSGEIYKVFTEKSTEYDFDGFSVIGQQSLTGYNWLESGKELEAATKGKLVETESGSGIYRVSFDNVKMGANYAYKVIENAVDSGGNSYFSIKSHTTNPNALCTVTFTYNSATKETHVSAKVCGDSTEYASQTVDVTSFSVIGSEELTGYFWLGDKDHPADQSEEAKEQYKKDAAKAGLMTYDDASSLYRKTYKNVKRGTYAFKVGANGSLDMSWGANESDENYTFSLTKTADVTISFNREKQTVSVSTTPTDALDVKQYVVTGTKNLMGETWDLNEAVMTYNEEAGVYEYTKNNVPSGQNYAFKIIEKGIDSGENISFSLADEQTAYNIKFTYNPLNGAVTKQAFNIETGEDVSDSVIKKVRITSYSVLGEKGLTGYNWLGLTDRGTPGTASDENAASDAGLMTSNSDGTYSKTFTGVKVGTNGETKTYPFKVAANGNWDSGISYGDENGGNYMLVLNGDKSGVTECDVTVTFNPRNSKITVETNPSDCNVTEVDDSKFVWDVVGDYNLVFFDDFKASKKVYDTVRDITSAFTFTTGSNTGEKGISWNINSQKNAASLFYDRIGQNGFTLDYDVDGKQSTGTFNTPVVDLSLDIVQEGESRIADYKCQSFMPGKQWLTISSYGTGGSNQYIQWMNDYKVYTEYKENLEKFNQAAEVYYKVLSPVLSDKTPEALVGYMENIKTTDTSRYNDLVNDYGDILSMYRLVSTPVEDPGVAPVVTDQTIVGIRNIRLIPTVYLEAGNDADVSVYESDSNSQSAKNIVTYDKNDSSDVTFTNIDGSFSYYNFAFTAGYAITDKIGLGIYDNYSKQDIQGYDSGKLREQNDAQYQTTGQYYAMASVLNEKVAYSDKDSDNKGLKPDKLVRQSLIGNSYNYVGDDTSDNSQKQCGQTIVKIYRVNEDGVSAKVSIDSTASKSSEEYANYMKWTGQQSFTTDDRGNYDVTFYWTLSDGRYLSDTKHVTVNVLHPGISKSVNIAYSEAGDNEITYTVTYTNSEFSSPITFGILDILPFKGDTRVGYKDDNQGTTGSDVRFNLKSMTVKQSGTATISGVYYSQSDSVRDWLTNGNREAAQNLNVGNDGKVQDTSGQWNNIIGSTGGRGTYTPNADNVTAIAVSGVQLGVSESITVTITLQYDGVQNDLYVNNAFFTASDMEGHNLFNGCSKPVSTNVVGRSINGYVWLDQNGDGIVGKDEQRFKSVTVSLYHINDEGKFVDTGESATTDQNGYYSFTNLSQGEYKIAVEKNKNPHLDTNTESYLFGKFTPTKKLLEAKAESVIGSRNLAEAELNDNSEIISYFIQSDMPTAFEIYRRIYTNNINATCDNCSYQKSYLNIGLTTPLCSITLYKRGEDDELLNGAAFKLEKYNKETQKWDEIKYDEEGYAVSDDIAEGTSKFVTGEKMPDGTQEKGKIYLPNLPEGKYRLTEVGAAEGYAPLLVTVNVELPYKIKTSEIEGYKADSLVKPSDLTKPDYTDGEYSYYRNITFTVKNAKDINRDLPLTGSDSFTWAVITGAALIILGAAAVSYGVYRKKRENAK